MLVLGLLPGNASFGSTAMQCWFWVYCHVVLVLGLLPCNTGFGSTAMWCWLWMHQQAVRYPHYSAGCGTLQ